MGTNISNGAAVASAKEVQRIRQKYDLLAREMDQRLRRQWAALEAQDLGWGGVRTVSLATGLDRHTILAGTRELERRRTNPNEKILLPARIPGRGRRPLIQTDPGLQTALETLVNPTTRGNSAWPLRWTCLSTAKLAQELRRQNHPVSDRTVAALLQAAGYILQDIRRCNEGSSHEDRDAQFARINEQTLAFHGQGQPVLWVDTKKRELAGEGHHAGQDWLAQRGPWKANGHDAIDGLTTHGGWVNVDVDHDTARFAAQSVGRWWQDMGAGLFPKAAKLLITADVGGSNSTRSRLWKVALQDLANVLGLPLEICHFPPGTIRWHKIEHRLCNFITKDWRGRPLVSYQVTANLIARTTNGHSSKVVKGNISPAKFHAEWNHNICPFR